MEIISRAVYLGRTCARRDHSVVRDRMASANARWVGSASSPLAWPFVLISPPFSRAFAVYAQRSSRVGEGGKWPSCALSYSLIYLGVQAVSDRIADKKELDMPG